MAQPTTTVSIGLTAPASESFTLDDSVRGELDSTFGLGGVVLTDVTNYVRTLSVRRGKSRILDNRFQAGVVSIQLDNRGREFDPTYASGPYFGDIVPRRDVFIQSNGNSVFRGEIKGWDFGYRLGGDSVVLIEGADAFSILANQILSPSYTPISESSGDRIKAVLDRPEVGFRSGRSIADGLSTLQADTISANQNVLNYIQLIEAGEPGAFFVSSGGVLTFEQRNQTPTQFTTFTFSDDGGSDAIEYVAIETDFTDELIYNRVSVNRKGGTAQVVNNLTSQGVYGVSTLEVNDLLLSTDAQSLNLANQLLGLFAEPQLRFKEVTIALHALDATKQSQVLGLELNDVVQVEFLPSRAFNPIGPAIEKFAFVEGISHSIGIDQHFVNFSLASTDVELFVLDDPIFGILDQDLLGY
jgi:hypothetical protein